MGREGPRQPRQLRRQEEIRVKEYTDEVYAAEVKRMEEAFAPLVLNAKRLGRAMRIGTNHGSLSDRIMNRWGDTPAGMVESALEFARVCRKYDFHNFVFSMKASNPKVMIECYRLLVDRLAELGPDWNYPIHLGVTEAGEGEDGRIKSAIGIGSLLCDGSATPSASASPRTVPAKSPSAAISSPRSPSHLSPDPTWPTSDCQLGWDPFTFARRASAESPISADAVRRREPVRVVVTRATFDKVAPRFPEGGRRPRRSTRT
jgi:(E)-4-hydroxy-3-methylbut-2-enyl-diphosphate synthase